jgi:hypothetical protein
MLTGQELQAALDDLLARGWFTNHGPLLAALERSLDGQAGWAGAAGLCSVAAGVFLWAAAVEPEVPIWVHPGLPELRGAALVGHDPAESPAQGATMLVPASALQLQGARRQLAVTSASHLPSLDRSPLASMAAALFIHTGTSPLSRSLGARGGVVLVRDPHQLHALRTARNHHANQTFRAVPLRFNSKMSEVQAVAAAADLLPAAEARAIFERLRPATDDSPPTA